MNEESLFHEALARSTPQDRSAFLAAACAGQPELREAVEALLAAHEQPGKFLSRSAAAVASGTGESDSLRAPDTENRAGETDRDGQRASPETVDAVSSRSSPESAVAGTPASDLPSRIGRYEIRRLLGRGGMGAVYLAHDPELDRPVALKVPKLSGPDAEERFLREARAAAAVTHPNLCPVYDAGRADGVLYLAMAYVPGSTLTEMLREKGPLAPAQAAAIVAGVARGMAEAHRHGIVHRDLKPGNILLDHKGEPVVTDFGLALRASVQVPAANPLSTVDHEPRLTQSGVLMGTPAYMPPEQARGDLDRIGPASDVYALGAILFELLTGRLPFPSVPLYEMVQQIENQPAPVPSTIRRGVPAGLDAICRQALAKDPKERFASMEAFAEALAPFKSSSVWRRWRRVVAAAAAFVVLACAAVVLYIATDNGTVEVRLSDSSANVTVTVDGKEIRLSDNGRITKLRTGPHGLEVKGEGFETVTRLFKVTRGETTVVEVELKPNVPMIGQPLPAADRARLAILLARGEALIKAGRFLELDEVANEALKIDPESPGALALRANYRLDRHDWAGAKADVEAALKLNPETFQALIVRVVRRLELSEGTPEDGIADLTIAIRLRPDNPIPWANRALLYFARGDHRQAIVDAGQAMQLGDKRTSALQTRAAAHSYLGQYQEALADYAIAMALAPKDPRSFIQRSAVYFKMGKKELADADWQTATKLVMQDLQVRDRPAIPDPPKPPERKKLTPAEAAAFDQAMQAAERTLKLDGRYDRKAIADACRIDPTSAAARTLNARSLHNSEQYADAVKEANEAIRLDPTIAWAYIARGLGRRNLTQDAVGAIADYTIAIRLDPRNEWAWHNRGYAYSFLGQYHQGVADFTEALRLKPSFKKAYAERRDCYLRIGAYENALTDCQSLIENQTANAATHRIYAAIHAKLGHFKEAQKQKDIAVNIDPSLKDAGYIDLPVPLPPVKKDPEPPEASAPAPDRSRLAELLVQGRKLVDDARYRELEPIATEALKIDAESPGGLALRATYRHTPTGDRTGARADAEAALKLNPETFQALIVRAALNGEAGNLDDAIADLTIAAQLAPKHPAPYSSRAHGYFLKKEYRQAIADASRAIELGFIRPEAFLTRAGAYVFLGEYRKALADLDYVAERTPNNPNVFMQRSAVHGKLGDPTKAGADWATAKTILPNLNDADRLVILDAPKAPERKKLTAAEADALAAALERGELAMHRDRVDDGRKDAEEACRIDPTSARAHALLGRLLAQKNLFNQALVEANTAIRLDPNNAWAFTTLGGAKFSKKDYAGAIADHTIALRLDPTLVSAWYHRGNTYIRRGQYHQALSDLNEALRQRPDFDQARASRGACFLRLAEYQKALDDYTKAAELLPTDPLWRRICAAIRTKLGDEPGAQKDRELAIQIDPKLKNAPDLILPVPLPPVKKDPEPSE